ncbi:chlorophyllide reductase [Mesorhizobium huakuii]|uniref:Chlorophyllide reductase n=1 Tax=Mesorhizobium huakuii TaxID=28104 RepID=A0A7G6T0A7_9HYPH|nr:chlorophyllide reductase [Mesorhizobium huakuii]QND60189.1 chlorophyllide reductase [Mesorhizobium huakuii]
MPSFKRETAVAAIGFMAALVMPFAAYAQPSTATGRISVGQVMEMIEKADSSPIARQTLVAYVAGVGEAAGAIVDTIGNGSRTVSCRKSFSLDTGSVRVALEAGAPRQDSWSQTPATPLIVADMVKRAGCRAKD